MSEINNTAEDPTLYAYRMAEREIDSFNKLCKRPPLGIVPMEIWREQRKQDIEAAIIRYALEEMRIPKEWICELQTLNSWLQKPNETL